MEKRIKIGHYSEKERVRKISKLIRYAESRLERKFSFLQNQNNIGMGIFLFSILGIITTSLLYMYGQLGIILTILINGIFTSFLHEIEHDLIHGIYFKGNWKENLMLWGVWIFRGNTPSPFYRKKIHLLHHRESGQLTDIEEQMIGNGMKFGLKRFFVMFDQNLAFLLNSRQVSKTAPELNRQEMALAAFPVTAFFIASFQIFIFSNIFLLINSLLGSPFAIPSWVTHYLPYLNTLAVTYLIPNFIRQGALQFISSNMHYFGDVNPSREGVLEQTQVLNAWFLFPFHLFCFNFGSTHSIHHFVVNQPFYIRQAIAPIAHKALKKYGVRFNDFGTFIRSNRYKKAFS